VSRKPWTGGCEYVRAEEAECFACGALTERWVCAASEYPLCGTCYATAEAEQMRFDASAIRDNDPRAVEACDP